ncbi:MAG: 1-aminocyclopropane-1-carboxylate deaminase/D-cysteine desulfhydrase [Gammaproteobacteria bacterium]|nr:MAG: 1-aminocyclopropane-1-carboxylate deaminase/D-cysteine desulfhydrase [Gammaproteobacteria bacterium]RLA59418.1 MAG: 1-aminocyclopropane-1-carboxylate deaminase/D-cysteine desulfhydrase [Gammaproteobacteria bacterium]
MNSNLLNPLDNMPVCDVAMGNVSLLRLDRTGGPAPGNKAFKLRENLAQAQRLGVSRLVSFGGAWSNHLHALAAVGRDEGLETVGIVRGEAVLNESAMLRDARSWGMQLVHVSRAEYQQRNECEYLQQIKDRFAPCLVIPEGGANAEGARGCMVIAGLVKDVAPQTGRIVLSVGTGTTLAGIAAGLGSGYEVVGISALKGAGDLERRVTQALVDCGKTDVAQWRILHDYHCGGFARSNTALRDFMLEFENVHGVPLEPVYTGKMLFALHQLLQCGEWDCTTPVLAIHTGGLQGRRGYSWLSSA